MRGSGGTPPGPPSNPYRPAGARRVVSTSEPPKTFISDLRPSRSATIEATVVQLEAPREVPSRDGSMIQLRNGRLKDGTGEIALVLWGAEVDRVAQGDHIRIVDGWVKDYQGRPQISLGRTGKLEKMEAAPAGRPPSSP